MTYVVTKMTTGEEGQRRLLEQVIETSRFAIADNVWQNSDGPQQDNHYKILARAFARDGMAGVDEVVQKALERHQTGLQAKSIADCLAQASQLMNARKRREASTIYAHVLSLEPNNTEALNNLGICLACAGNVTAGLDIMGRALTLQPMLPKNHSSLGENTARTGPIPGGGEILSVLSATEPH